MYILPSNQLSSYSANGIVQFPTNEPPPPPGLLHKPRQMFVHQPLESYLGISPGMWYH